MVSGQIAMLVVVEYVVGVVENIALRGHSPNMSNSR